MMISGGRTEQYVIIGFGELAAVKYSGLGGGSLHPPSAVVNHVTGCNLCWPTFSIIIQLAY